MKNYAGRERWIVLKQIPRPQRDNPMLNYEDSADIQEKLRLNKIRNENMLFQVDEILIRGIGDLQNRIFSADNDMKYLCKDEVELRYFIEQGFVRKLPYSREEIDNLKKNWLNDPVYELKNFPGADEYWDELNKFEAEKTAELKSTYSKIESLAAGIASIPLMNINFEMLLIGFIATSEPDASICLERAKGIIFEMSREQYNLQQKESKKDERPGKLGPRKSATTSSK